MERGRCVTVFTDASFCPRTMAAGFAVWIKVDGRTIRHAGAFKIEVKEAWQAELAALANGICGACAVLNLADGDMIVAATDCLRAIDILERRGGKPTKAFRDVREHTLQELTKRGVLLRLKHVKAHQGKEAGRRNAVNEWCDGAAKRVMRSRRRSIAQQEHV